MAADGGVRGVMDRPRAHERLGGPEQLLHLDQVTIPQDCLQWADPGIAAQHEDPIEAGFVGEPAGIDLERAPTSGGAQIAPIGRVADQRLDAARFSCRSEAKPAQRLSSHTRARVSSQMSRLSLAASGPIRSCSGAAGRRFS